MVEKKIQGKTQEKKTEPSNSPKTSYTMSEVFKITDDLFMLSKEREYPMGAFVHGLIFALEFAQHTYRIPPQQLAEIKRDCRRYVDEMIRINALKTTEDQKKK